MSRLVISDVDWSANEEQREYIRDQIQQFALERGGLKIGLQPYKVKETKCAAHVVQLAVKDFLRL